MTGKSKQNALEGLLGLGEFSSSKSYYPELQRTIGELNRTKDFLASIIDSMPSAIIGIDLKKQITLWNSNAEKRFGISKEQCLGKPLFNIIPANVALKTVYTCLNENRIVEQKRVELFVGDDKRYEDYVFYPLGTDALEGVVVRIDDVTRQCLADAFMVHTEKLISLGGMAAGMAHEINNPLGGILQNAYNLRTRLGDAELDANRKTAQELGISMEQLQAYHRKRRVMRMIDNIVSSGLRATAIVENLLNFTRESQRRYDTCNLAAILEDSIALMKTEYEDEEGYDFKSIAFKLDIDPNLKPVSCDSSRIQQVFINLLKNAADAVLMPQETKSPKITISMKNSNTHIWLSLADNGIGMSDEQVKRAFDPFYTTKEIGKGTGLGLSVCHSIVTEAHKGTIVLKSHKGEGTTVTIQLPHNCSTSESQQG